MTRIETRNGGRLPVLGPFVERIADQWDTLLGATARKTYLSLADQAVVSGTRFVATLMIGRYCGAVDLGNYSLVFTLMILVLGTQQALIGVPYTVFGHRLRGDDRAECAGSGVVHSLVLMGFAVVALLGFGLFDLFQNGWTGLAPIVLVLAAMIPFALLQDLARRYAFAHLHTGLALMLDIGVATIQIGGLGLLWVTDTLTPGAVYAVLGLGCALIGAAVWFAWMRKIVAFRRAALLPDWKKNWKFGKWVFGALTSSMLNGYVMYWFLKVAMDSSATGIYAACMTPLFFSNPFLMGIGNILTPRSAQAFAQGGNTELRRVVFKSTFYIGSTMTLFCVLVACFGDTLVQLLYSSEFAGYGSTVAVLAFGFLAGSWSLGAIDGLLARERPDINFKTSMLGLITKVGVAALLVGQFGILGAAIGSLVGSTLMSVVRWIAFFQLVRPDELEIPEAGVNVGSVSP